MDALMRSMDWSKTPLGPVELWSPALQIMVRVLLANRLPMVIWWGPQFCQLYNDAFSSAFAAKLPGSMGQPASECWAGIWHTLRPLIEKSFRAGEAALTDDLSLEMNRRGFTEETHWTIAYSPIPDDTMPNQIGGVLGTVHEIREKVVADRKRAETALREAHDQRQMILNSMNDRFFALDSKWRYTYFNRQAEAQLVALGKDPASLIGRVLWEEFPNPPTEEILRRAMRERIPLTHEHYYAPLGEWVENRVYPTSDGGLAIFQQYVTERKRAERELLALKDELAAELSATTRLHEFSTGLLANPEVYPTLQRILDAVILLQGADFGAVQLYNPAARALQIVAQRGFAQDFLDYFNTVRDGSSACGRALQQRERIIIEDVLTDPGYAPHRQIAASAGFRAVQSTPLLSSRTGEPLGMISTHFRSPHRPSDRELRFTDLYARQAAEVVERKLAEDALRETQAELTHLTRVVAMGELTSSIAHEINQPLTAVVANANACSRMLAASDPDLREIQSAVQDIAAAGTRAANVISRIRGLLRKAVPEEKRLDANEIIREVLGFTGGELQKHKVSVRTELCPDLPPVLGDSVQLQQVVLNLVVNAIEAMAAVDQPRVLRVRSSRPETGGVSIAIEDSGPGLNAANAEQIFDTFFTTKQQGMGMGLPISRSIIVAHGGRLWAEPLKTGGTRFQFTLARTA
jgi:signal transduction histidine kinase/PAS domain-containing protein